MSDGLREFLDLNRVGETPVTLAGRLELDSLLRLHAVARPGGYAEVRLRAASARGRCLVSGQVRAQVPLTCQRCLGAMTYPVAAEIRLMWTRASRDAVQPPQGYDAIVSASGRVRVANLVEDELLLALPLVARHATPELCASGFALPPLARTGEDAARRPFAALQALKHH